MKFPKRMTFWLGTTLGIVALVALAIATIRPPVPPTPSPRLTIAGQQYFLSGLNYPWRTYQDFGTGAWGYSGVAQATTYAEVDTDFANMAARGVRVVKWRIFNDGRYSPEFNKQGYVTGFDNKFYADIDAAIKIAQKHDIYLVFSLFANGFWTTSCSSQGVQLGGHADVITDSSKRRSLIENAIVPLMRHIGHNPRVVGFEIVAEPEWGVSELNQAKDDYRIKVDLNDVRLLVADTARVIHQYTSALASIESNRSRNMRNWRGLGLDYYSFSWYDWLEPYDPLNQPASAIGVDRSVVIGEFPLVGSKYYQANQVLDIAYRQGYAGAFGWSYWGGDKYGQFNDIANIFINWERGHWTDINLGEPNTLPKAGAPLLPLPYAVNLQTVSGSGGAVSMQAQVFVRQQGTYHLQFFLQDVANKDNRIEVEQDAAFPQDGSQRFLINFYGVRDGRSYKINLGIFDQSYALLKWFDGLTMVTMKNGATVAPNLSVQALEDPCYGLPQ